MFLETEMLITWKIVKIPYKPYKQRNDVKVEVGAKGSQQKILVNNR